MGKVRPTIALTSDDIEDGAILNVDVNASAAIANSKMASDTTNATNLASGTVPTARLGSGSASSSTFLRGDQTYAAVDTSGITANQDDIALLGFKVAANGSLARYNLVDQSIDAFEDASGVDASASTNETRDSSGNYYSGTSVVVDAKTSSGANTWTCPAGVTSTEILIVAGGAGSSGYGGGGGAGGVVHNTSYTVVPAVEYDITVGAGSAGTAYNFNPVNGSDSVFNVNSEGSGSPMTAVGGGFGSGKGTDGGDGGSGGGGNGGHKTDGGSGTQGDSGGGTGYGNDGGDAYALDSTYSAGGGGGANAAGVNGAVSNDPGEGGDGKLFSTFVAYGTDSSNVASTGSNGGYFGGGGGGASASAFAAGGVGGGNTVNGGDALVNTGGGGGGGTGTPTTNGGDGGTGVVLIAYTAYNDMTLISNAQTAQSAPTNGDLVITYTDAIGTATVNTDIKAYISRDGSAYTSAVTLVSQGTTGGHTILTANGVDISGITSGTSMRWKIETLNQSASKSTRIQAVSLGWS